VSNPWPDASDQTDEPLRSDSSGREDEPGSVSPQAGDAYLDDLDDGAIHPDDVAAIRKSLVFYRVMAYVVGVLLVVLVCVGVPLKYLADDSRVVTWTGVPHGWLYMILIISAVNVGRRVRWSWTRLILIALAGTVPFLSFVAEHYATKDVRAKLALVPATDEAIDHRAMCCYKD
jgi:integral membrane protein